MSRKSILIITLLALLVGRLILPGTLSAAYFIVNVPGGTTPEAYRIVGWPIYPSPNPWDQLRFEFGGFYDDKKWRWHRWCPVSHTYTEAFAADPIAPGRGYWLISRDPWGVKIDGAMNMAATKAVPLEMGWNQVANPYDVGLDWANDCQVWDGGATYIDVTDAGNTYTSHTFWAYSNSGTYFPASFLPAGRGGFVFAHVPGWYLVFINGGQSPAPAMNLGAVPAPGEPTPPPPPGGFGGSGGSAGGGCFLSTVQN